MGNCEALLQALRSQRELNVDGGVYKACQCDFAYNSNHIEGSTLTHEQTVTLFERNVFSGAASFDDIVEAKNHFDAFDLIIDRYAEPLTKNLLFDLHRELKKLTSDERNPLMAVGSFKRFENFISSGFGSVTTAKPDAVEDSIDRLFAGYEGRERIGFEEVVGFHVAFERIHPFSDGNGRVGRLLMFKECLRHDITPFIVTQDLRDFYIRGLQQFGTEKGYLMDTLLTAQDRFEAVYMPQAVDYVRALDEQELNRDTVEVAEEAAEFYRTASSKDDEPGIETAR